MSAIHIYDKVICIDATPIPIGAKGHDITDFSFPGGFISEGDIYCVTDVKICLNQAASLQLAGKPILFCGEKSAWNSGRFRKISRNKNHATREAKQTVVAGFCQPSPPQKQNMQSKWPQNSNFESFKTKSSHYSENQKHLQSSHPLNKPLTL